MDDLHPALFVFGFFALVVAAVFGVHWATPPPPAPVKVECVSYGRVEVCTLPDGTRCALTGDSRGGIDCDWRPAVAEKR